MCIMGTRHYLLPHTTRGWSCLHKACHYAHAEVVYTLLRYGADVDLARTCGACFNPVR